MNTTTEPEDRRPGTRKWHELRRRANVMWTARCGEPSTNEAERVEIIWPSGQKQTLTPEKVDTTLTIEEPR